VDLLDLRREESAAVCIVRRPLYPTVGLCFAFQQNDETYALLATSLTAPCAKTGLYVPELGKMFELARIKRIPC
jgi:hypothetical protein